MRAKNSAFQTSILLARWLGQDRPSVEILSQTTRFGSFGHRCEVEERTGGRYSDDFERKGEEGFRRREAHVVDDCARMSAPSLLLAEVVLRPVPRERQSGFVGPPECPTTHPGGSQPCADKNRPPLKVDDPLLLGSQQLFAQRGSPSPGSRGPGGRLEAALTQ